MFAGGTGTEVVVQGVPNNTFLSLAGRPKCVLATQSVPALTSADMMLQSTEAITAGRQLNPNSPVRRGKKAMSFQRLRRWSSKLGIRYRNRLSTAGSACSTLVEDTRTSEAALKRPPQTVLVVYACPHT